MRTGRLSKKLIRDMDNLHQIGTVLLKDVEISTTEVFRLALLAANQGSPDLKVTSFWVKTLIRSLMGLMDGLSSAMRRAVLKNADDVGLLLSTKERARLQERQYDSKLDSILDKPNHLSPAESFKLAFKLYPKLFGSAFAVDTSGRDWLAVRRIVDIRNRFTHPTCLDHLSVHLALPALGAAHAWLLTQVTELLAEISLSLGVIPKEMPSRTIPTFRESDAPMREFFSPEDYRRIESYGGRTLKYFETMFFLLKDDTSLAMDLCKGSFDSVAALKAPRYQFAYRTLARTLFSDIEGQIFATRFFIEAAQKRGEVTLSEEDVHGLNEGEVEDQLVATANLWSREFGHGKQIAKTGSEWDQLRRARHFRDRITHPRDLESVNVSMRMTSTLLDGFGFSIRTSGFLDLDPDKWAGKAVAVEEAVAREEGQPLAEGDEEE